ncbi:hypothetical protein [Thiohalorhabdus sp.]|uniref:hypothetical protein n=1 Tax=Thiohalorhabdus sp. TaxID=3094134 RepID=UPI002FC3DBC0
MPLNPHQTMAEMLEQINAVEVTEDEMARVASALEGTSEEGGEPYALLDKVKEEFDTDLEGLERVAAVFFRFQALGRLVRDHDLPEWALPESAECGIPLRGPLLAAAAFAPVEVDNEERASFDREAILEEAEQHAGSQGKG